MIYWLRMPSTDQPHQPDRESKREEQEPTPYYEAARYADKQSSVNAYERAQELIHKTPCDLSAFRLQLNHVWHVAVLGTTPPSELEQPIRDILSTGEPATLPSALLTHLTERRGRANQFAPWVERHYRPK
jgi:hypothetical protein